MLSTRLSEPAQVGVPVREVPEMNPEVLRQKLERHVDDNDIDNFQYLLSHFLRSNYDQHLLESLCDHAAVWDRSACFSELLNQGVQMGYKQLIRAAEWDSKRVVLLLLEAGLNINAHIGYMYKYTPVDLAHPSILALVLNCYHRKHTALWLIDHCGADVNQTSPTGTTPLSAMCEFTDSFFLDDLVKRGADLAKGGLLQIAVRSVDELAALLDHGVPINARELEGQREFDSVAADRPLGTALHVAAEAGNEKAVRYLLRRGADPRVRDTEGQTPADVAEAQGFTGLAKVLAGNGSFSKI